MRLRFGELVFFFLAGGGLIMISEVYGITDMPNLHCIIGHFKKVSTAWKQIKIIVKINQLQRNGLSHERAYRNK